MGYAIIHLPEHADLVDNVVPIAGRLHFLRQQSVKLLAHCNNPVGHCGDIPFPLFKKVRVRQNQCDLHASRQMLYYKSFIPTYQTRPMGWRITDLAPLQD